MTPKQKQATKQKKTVSALETLGITPKWNTFAELKTYKVEGVDGGKKRLSFDELCELRAKLYDEIQFRKERLEKVDEEIKMALAMAGVEKVEWEDRPVQLVTSHGGSRIVAEKLLELGVEADTVAQATVPGKEYDYVLFGKVKG
jgi:hypothetical protein